jgi:peptide/nickel transport system permease protein
MSLRYIGSRVVHSAIGVVVVLLLVFVVTHLVGDPVRIVLPITATEAQVSAVRERLHLNDPFLAQLARFVAGAATGSFGDSFWQRVPAMPLVLHRLPATAFLTVVAFILIIPLGVGVGILAALRPGSVLERFLNVLSLISTSIVDFWLALMLILVFSVTLRWLPTSGYGRLEHVILPALTLTVLQIGGLAQITRVTVAEELRRSYVSAARARGISEARVILRHALRNALVPIVTVSGTILAGMMAGVIIVEVVYGWPGLGLLLAQALVKGDLPLIEASVFVTCVLVILINLVSDLIYGLVNPRVRMS